MLNIHDLKAAYEKAILHETSNGTVYNVLARHGWREQMPRPFHPKRDIAAQPATAMLGPDRHQARGRLGAHSRIHLFAWRGLFDVWQLRLSDHADNRIRCASRPS